MKHFHLNKATCQSQELEEDSIDLVKRIFKKTKAVTSGLKQGDKNANTDGEIMICDENNEMECKIVVQIKHLTHPTANGKTFYDIPSTIMGYADRCKGEVVMFLACDTDNDIVYWKNIDNEYIYECEQKSSTTQQTYRYYFKSNESLSADNKEEVIETWRKIFLQKKELIKTKCDEINNFITLNKEVFNSIISIFHGLPKSHIHRKETDKLFSWITSFTSEDNVKLLVGNAGSGKSVVIKDLIQKLDAENIINLSIKADSSKITGDNDKGFTLDALHNVTNYLSYFQGPLILIIDQIDTLSQNLSNDRNKLNNILATIATLTKDKDHRIRIIITCRKFDLKYDATLNTLNKYSSIEIAPLSEIEINKVLTTLDNNLPSKMSPFTLSLMQTPQYLDIFCRIYTRGSHRYDYKNPTELYDELWNQHINTYKVPAGSDTLKDTAITIASLIHDSDTLTPAFIPEKNNTAALNYLASNDIIRYKDKRVSYFHQSFYEYIMARYYYNNNATFINELNTKFQGLEQRSVIKSLLEYERDHNEKLYIENIKYIIFSPQVRLHLKQLALSIISYAQETTDAEYNIISHLPTYNIRLFSYFVSVTTAPQWFNTLRIQLLTFVPGLTQKSAMLNPIAAFMSRYSFSHPDETYSMLSQITEKETRQAVARSLMYSHNDYRKAVVHSWYNILKTKEMETSIHWVEDAMKTNYMFALEEIKKHIIYFNTHNKYSHESTYPYYLVKKLCDKLYKNDPKNYLTILKDSYIHLVTKTKTKKYYYWYNTCSAFYPYMDDYKETIYEHLGSLLERYAHDEQFIVPIVKDLYDLSEEMSFNLAFRTMACNPAAYDSIIREIVSDNTNIDRYFLGEFEYYFLETLRQWYLTLSTTDKEWYQNHILNFKSETDCYTNKDSSISPLKYLHLWQRKWILISVTLPEETLIPALKKCKGELQRRFKGKYINRKPDHTVTCANICGGIVSPETYKKLSMHDWYNSILKTDENQIYHKNQYRPVDTRVHAGEFTNVVAEFPCKYKTMVYKLFADDTIETKYKLAGLEGLLKGGIDKTGLIPLTQHFTKNGYLNKSFYEVENILKYYTTADSQFLNELIPALVEVTTQPLENNNYDTEHDKDINNRTNSMLMAAINSNQGRALEMLMSLCTIKERRTQIYETLINLCTSIPYELKIQVLIYINTDKYYDKALYEKLLPIYLKNMQSEALYASAGAIQWYLYYKPSIVSTFINKIKSDPDSHVFLSEIFYYGMNNEDISEETKQQYVKQLEELMTIGTEKAVSKMVELSFKYITLPNLTDISQKLLLQFRNDRQPSVHEAYMHYCEELPSDYFQLFEQIFEEWHHSDENENIYGQIKYIQKSISLYPSKCYHYIKTHGIITNDFKYSDYDTVNILIEIYKKLKTTGNETTINEVMDFFDNYILVRNSTLVDALQKMQQ